MANHEIFVSLEKLVDFVKENEIKPSDYSWSRDCEGMYHLYCYC